MIPHLLNFVNGRIMKKPLFKPKNPPPLGMPFYRKRLNTNTSSSRVRDYLSKAKQFFSWRAIRTMLTVGTILFVIGVFSFTLFAAWVSRDLPDPEVLSSQSVPQSTKIYDRSGEHLLYEIHGDEKRTLIKVQDIPDVAKYATIAIEDKKLGTGGAIKHGLQYVEKPAEPTIILNGDVLTTVDLSDMIKYLKPESDGIILGSLVEDVASYGTLVYDKDYHLQEFKEKEGIEYAVEES